MNTTTPHITSALCERLGLKAAPGFYRSTIFLSGLAIGAVFWIVLPFLAVVQPLPWLRILSLPFLLAVLWQPIVEELLFRGCLQGLLSIREWGQRSLVGISIANILTSVVFTGAHIATHSLPWALSTVFPSLLFGVLRDRSGSVVPSMALHIVYNAGYFLLTGGSSLV
ncbi:MAG TPA: JDVT-CTERM system glutamic-type intramembrane protease [Nitrospiraceae bacterium]|nr:JDVT-CTERM system glutamic-type intramembrane protease [Nitrospiraceae bacterium]